MARLIKKYTTLPDGTKSLKGYYGRWYDRNRRPRQKELSLATRNEKQARMKLAQLEFREIAGEFDPWKDRAPKEGVLLAHAGSTFIRERERQMASGEISSATVRADRSVINLFTDACPPGLTIAHVQPEHIKHFLATCQISRRSHNTYIARLSGFFNWSRKRGLIKDNPVLEVGRKRERRGRETGSFPYLTRTDFERLMTTIEIDAQRDSLKGGEVRWLADICRVMVGTGLRPSEATHLSWHWISDLHGEAPMIHILIREGEFIPKWHCERTVPLVGPALEIIRRLHAESDGEGFVFRSRRGRKRDRPNLSAEYVSGRFLHYRRMARLSPTLTLYSLRHTYASWLVIAGVDLYRVQRLLGHRSVDTTMRYAHLAPENMRGDVGRVFGNGS